MPSSIPRPIPRDTWTPGMFEPPVAADRPANRAPEGRPPVALARTPDLPRTVVDDLLRAARQRSRYTETAGPAKVTAGALQRRCTAPRFPAGRRDRWRRHRR